MEPNGFPAGDVPDLIQNSSQRVHSSVGDFRTGETTVATF
jgi:hypothetical protein